MKIGDVVQVGTVTVMCRDATTVEPGDVGADTHFVDPPYDNYGLYSVIPQYQSSGYLAVSWGYRSFGAACVAADNRGWPPMFEAVWDCVASWYTPSNPLVRHRSIGVYGERNTFRFADALVEPRVPPDAMQCDMWGGETHPEARIVKNSRGTHMHVPNRKHLSTVYRENNATMKKSGHSHAKPVRWLAAIIAGLPGQVVLDYFGGTGAVAEASVEAGKRCVTIEVDPQKCANIVTRIQHRGL